MYHRPIFELVRQRLLELPKRIQILAGPRQIGKTTLVRQLLAQRPAQSAMYLSADEPVQDVADWSHPASGSVAWGGNRLPDRAWLVEKWQQAAVSAQAWQRSEKMLASQVPFVLVIDEIQKISQWSEVIKGLWDRGVADELPMHVVLLGSSPLLMHKGITESLAGRFEVLRMAHWSFEEMNAAFGFSLDQYIYFGGFPGSAPYVVDESRWRAYVALGLIQPNIERDILQMTRIDKPALLKQLFELGCNYSGQIVSLDKMLGQLSDAGNVTTLARYLELLGEAGLLTGLQKHSDKALRRRNSPPKFQTLNNALTSAQGSHSFDEARADRSHWGHLVESAIGAHLCNTAASDTRIHYWREASLEVDFVIEHRGRLAAIEVKGGKLAGARRGLDEFVRRHPGCQIWVVGSDALPVGEFLRHSPEHWLD
ncbi:ATP-binding protein [Aquabacterium sp.]|uniref:ATP-binding protein n=1 Tax=Aquabacterium sp. TaxID=1872578 RepID=UPI0025C6143B|nr:ATP-binding protein [Aquabacterium sp.]